ncbi:phosphonoacetaldehyde hydrolase [Pararhizobium qamdonense]|uniref:phosphonoacetaldehyde hydrolase n=1 Tax=Pararhizobium qamdonense TaxID=3031126 RepID=UPI0023E323CC|nr:phosphonoacetaldehyde hydrolase [Pararhizobium qamdonense]
MSKIEAVIFDWAGTLVDFGSRAPMGAFIEAFASLGVTILLEEARAPMGRAKRDHIEAILTQPRVAEAWASVYGKAPDQAAIDLVYETFLPLNIASAASHSAAIPGAADALMALRERGLKIGSTTGYTRTIMQQVLPIAAQQKVETDFLVCCDEVIAGRPSAAGMFLNFVELDLSAAHLTVKVDDTPVGISEGRNAGSWTIGLTLSGNETGLSEEELAAVTPAERAAMAEKAAAKFREAGAHFTIETIADLLPVIDEIDRHLAAGERP